MEDTLLWAIALVVVVAIALVRRASRQGQPGPRLDIGHEIKSGITALGCLVLLVLTFGGMIAWADMSVAKSDQATLAGIVTVVASVLGLCLLIRVIRSLPSWGVMADEGEPRGQKTNEGGGGQDEPPEHGGGS